jgi:hypothetical protein
MWSIGEVNLSLQYESKIRNLLTSLQVNTTWKNGDISKSSPKRWQ